MNITEMCEKAHKTAKEHGFWDGMTLVSGKMVISTNTMLAKLSLIHSEVSEAVEEVRSGNTVKISEELADILIRTADFAAALDLDLNQAVQDKMTKNEGRPWKHGRLA